jgi:hypothetical protein
LAEVDAVDESEIRELVEHAIDACDTHRALPSARRPSKSSCAERQQSCSARYEITAARAPPERAPARRSSVYACSAQLSAVVVMSRMVAILRTC